MADQANGCVAWRSGPDQYTSRDGFRANQIERPLLARNCHNIRSKFKIWRILILYYTLNSIRNNLQYDFMSF